MPRFARKHEPRPRAPRVFVCAAGHCQQRRRPGRPFCKDCVADLPDDLQERLRIAFEDMNQKQSIEVAGILTDGAAQEWWAAIEAAKAHLALNRQGREQSQ